MESVHLIIGEVATKNTSFASMDRSFDGDSTILIALISMPISQESNSDMADDRGFHHPIAREAIDHSTAYEPRPGRLGVVKSLQPRWRYVCGVP